jgi:hypothetical protein
MAVLAASGREVMVLVEAALLAARLAQLGAEGRDVTAALAGEADVEGECSIRASALLVASNRITGAGEDRGRRLWGRRRTTGDPPVKPCCNNSSKGRIVSRSG